MEGFAKPTMWGWPVKDPIRKSSHLGAPRMAAQHLLGLNCLDSHHLPLVEGNIVVRWPKLTDLRHKRKVIF